MYQQETDEETYRSEQQLVNLIGHMSKAAACPKTSGSANEDGSNKVS